MFDNDGVLEALGRVRAAAVGCADMPVWSLSDAEVIAALDLVQVAEQALAAVKLHLVRQVDTRGVPAAQHATSCAGWLRHRLRVGSATARRLVELSRALDDRPDLDRALVAGAVNVEQAAVVEACVSRLPAEAGVEAAAKAETVLIGWARDFDPHGLRRLGARVLEHVAPQIADRIDAAALARLEARAYQARTVSLVPAGGGRVRLSGWLDAESAAVIAAALDPLCVPRRELNPAPSGNGGVGGRTAGQRRADALVEVCRLALRTGELPVNGGDRPQLGVTVAFDPLSQALGMGTLDTGERLTPGQVRRLACDAQILPAVLGSEGQVLDVGRTRRLITGALRRALVLRDRGCAFPGCDRPARWCDGHHIRAFLDGGPTSLDNAVLLCGHHHRVVHHHDWQVRLGRDGLPDFIPPAYLDPDQLPRRNPFHDRR